MPPELPEHKAHALPATVHLLTVTAVHAPIKLAQVFEIFKYSKVLYQKEKQGDRCALSTWRNCAILIYLGHMANIPLVAGI